MTEYNEECLTCACLHELDLEKFLPVDRILKAVVHTHVAIDYAYNLHYSNSKERLKITLFQLLHQMMDKVLENPSIESLARLAIQSIRSQQLQEQINASNKTVH